MDCCVNCVEVVSWVQFAREALIAGFICFICWGFYKICQQ
jgi:hypothetical protein